MSRLSIAVALALLLAAGASTAQSGSVQDQIMSLNEAAARFDRIGKLDSAWIAADSAVRWSEKTLGPDHPVTALSINSLATLMYNWGRIEKADSLYRRILGIWEKQPPTDSAVYGAALYNHGTILMEKRQIREAIETLTNATRVLEAALGAEDQYLANALYSLAEAYRSTKDCSSAIPLYRRAIAIRTAAAAPADLGEAQALNSLGICLVATDSLLQAEKAYQRALTIVSQVNGPDDISAAYCMDNLARLYLRQRRFPEANRLSSVSLELFREGPGNESPEVAQALILRGEILLDSDQFEAAVSILAEADQLLTRLAGPSHPTTKDIRLKLAAAYDGIGDTANARATLKRAGIPIDQSAPQSDSN